MSTSVMALCWPLQMPPTPKAVLISLADNANDQGHCWPSIPTICERTCFGERTVHGAIKWLEDHGVLRADRSNGRHTRYVVTPSAYEPPQELRHRSNCATAADAVKPPQELRQPPQQMQSPPQELRSNRQEPSLTVSKSKRQSMRATTKPVDAHRFDEFWSAYPVKAGKSQCLGKWRSRKLDAIADQILADVARKAEKDRRWLEGYIPNPQTYINQDRWNDPVQPLSRDGPAPSTAKPAISQNFSDKTYEGTPDDQLPDFLRADAA